MFKAIVYTNKSDKLTSTIVSSDGWNKKYNQLFAKGINCDQCAFAHSQEFSSELEAKSYAQSVINKLRAGVR